MVGCELDRFHAGTSGSFLLFLERPYVLGRFPVLSQEDTLGDNIKKLGAQDHPREHE